MKSPGLAPGSQVTCPKCGKGFALGGAPKPEAPRPPSPPPARPKAPAMRPPTEARPAAAPKPPPPQLDPIPATPLSAAAATQPAHRPPDQLVDPNLLPPPKPRPKPKLEQVPVVCKLCGTRMHVPLAKIGQTIQCPDCHSIQEIKAPAAPAMPKKAGPTLDEAPDIGLSEPVERPKYRPIVAPRDDDAILSQLEGADHPPGWSAPEPAAPPVVQSPTAPAAADPPRRSRAPAPGAPAVEPEIVLEEIPPDAPAAAPAEYEAPPEYAPEEVDGGDADPELALEAPVDRIEVKPELPKTYLAPDPEEERLISGRYDDDDMLGGGHVDRKSPEAWKRAPFLYGLVEFLVYPSTLPRLIAYSVGAVIIASLFGTAMAYTTAGGMATVAGMMLYRSATVFGLLYVIPLSACALAIVQDTANGVDAVESWPDWNVGEWFGPALYFPAAAFVAAFPGMVLAWLLSLSEIPAIVPPIPIVLCLVAFFPLVLFSMLVEGSVMAPFSPHAYKSLTTVGEGWMLFYVYTIPLGVFGGLGLGVMVIGGLAWGIVGALLAISIMFLYCRILGRLMWYSQNKKPRRSPA